MTIGEAAAWRAGAAAMRNRIAERLRDVAQARKVQRCGSAADYDLAAEIACACDAPQPPGRIPHGLDGRGA
jgi:hypothetical protein